MAEIQMRSDLARDRQPHISEGRFLARLVRIGIVKQPASTEAAREWLNQGPEATESRDRLMAQVYVRVARGLPIAWHRMASRSRGAR